MAPLLCGIYNFDNKQQSALREAAMEEWRVGGDRWCLVVGVAHVCNANASHVNAAYEIVAKLPKKKKTKIKIENTENLNLPQVAA